MLIHTSNLPVTANPHVTVLARTADLVHVLQRNKLSDMTLPEIQTVVLRVKLRVRRGDAIDGVGHTKDTALIKARVLARGRGSRVDTNDKGSDLVTR